MAKRIFNYYHIWIVLFLLILIGIMFCILSKNWMINESFTTDTPSYFITTICVGDKYTPIRPHWEKRVQEMTSNDTQVVIFDESVLHNYPNKFSKEEYAWWDLIRMHNNIELLQKYHVPVVHCDIDLILSKNITPIVNLPYDFIISMEHYGDKAYPAECSKKLGFGVCSGFFILKDSSLPFIEKMYEYMKMKKYGLYSDQVTIMNYITQNKHVLTDDVIVLDGISFTNKVIQIDGIKIGVLDFDLITRDPRETKKQYGNHIHIENAGGTEGFIRFFYERIEDLPDVTAFY